MKPNPIPLTSEDWRNLRHAYGAASDIPKLLQQLANDPRPGTAEKEPWHSLWSALCHQGDVYEASYAAVAHIVSIGIDASGAIDPGFFSLPACIEIARARGRGPIVPAFLQASYADGLRLLHECAYQHRQDNWSDDMAQSVAAALAAAAGQHDLAEAIVTLDQEIIAKIISLEL